MLDYVWLCMTLYDYIWLYMIYMIYINDAPKLTCGLLEIVIWPSVPSMLSILYNKWYESFLKVLSVVGTFDPAKTATSHKFILFKPGHLLQWMLFPDLYFVSWINICVKFQTLHFLLVDFGGGFLMFLLLLFRQKWNKVNFKLKALD